MKSTVHSKRPPSAVVINLDCITGLQTARILASHQLPVIAVAKDPTHFCCKTNVCDRILFADTETEELIEALERLGNELEEKAVLFPCADPSVLLISRHRQRLEKWFHIVLPQPDVVEMLMDKFRFYSYAQEARLPIPRTFFLYTRADAEQAARELTFPCVLKPSLKTREWLEQGGAKVYKVQNWEELLSLYDRISAYASILMVQEWIEGSDANLYSCNTYFSPGSEPLVTFIARKIRQWPPEAGTSCLGEECRNDIVLQESIRLFQSVGYCGLGYLEMKRDERTGEHFIIEPNIGRPTGRSAIAEAGGVALLYTQYCDAVGWPLPENRRQKYEGVKWIYLRRDLQSAFYYWRRGELTLRDWWRSLRGRKGYAVFSWTDPGPFLADFGKSISRSIDGLLSTGKRQRQATASTELREPASTD